MQKIYIRIIVVVVVCVSLAGTIRAADIHSAVLDGDLETVTTVIENNPDMVNNQDGLGKTPLHYAIEAHRTDIARYLIEHGADVNLADSDGNSPLHTAASEGQTDIAAFLLEKGATTVDDVTVVKHGGIVGQWTPLHLASLYGYPETVKLLLDHGANIEAIDGARRTPLIITGQSHNLDVAKILINRGADIGATAIRGYTALLWAARNRFGAMVDLLIEKGAAVSDQSMITAFDLAVTGGLPGLYAYVQESGFNIRETVEPHPSFILQAVAGGSVPIVKSLIDNGMSLDYTDRDGWSTLHYAVSRASVDIVQFLVDNGVDINARNLKGETAYNVAMAQDNLDAADYLRSVDADTSAPQFLVLTGPYMGQTPPGDEPEMFLPGIVSGHDRAHSSIAFSPDGDEAYWTEMIPPEGRVAVMKRVDNVWTYPEASPVERDPSFSPDGKRLYFIKTRPFKPGEEPGGDPDVKEEYWYMEKTASGWSDPVSVGDAVNAIGVHWPCSVDKDYNLYFSEFSDHMYVSEYTDGEYRSPIPMTEYFGNDTFVGRSPFMSPDGDYLLFSTDEGIKISIRQGDGSWTDAVTVGDTINANHENGCPRVSPDGKYMFFVSAGSGRPWGIYWVSTAFLDRLRAAPLDTE